MNLLKIFKVQRKAKQPQVSAVAPQKTIKNGELPENLVRLMNDPEVAKFVNDPSFENICRFFKNRLKFATIISKLFDQTPIIFGISSGLLGMSLVAVIFHFIRNVVDLDTSMVLESVSYSVFFLALSIGIGSKLNKERRDRDKLHHSEIKQKEKIDSICAKMENIVQESRKLVEKKGEIIKEKEQLKRNEEEKKSSIVAKEGTLQEIAAKVDKLYEEIKIESDEINDGLAKQQSTKLPWSKRFPSFKRKK